MEETFRPIKDCPNYVISNLGRIIHMSKRGMFEVKGHLHHSGYIYLDINENNIRLSRQVHRLVAEAFISNTENKPCVDHINTIKTDNRVENLRWVTFHENNMNELTNQHQHCPHKGKAIIQYSLDGEYIAEYQSAKEAGRVLGINSTAICFCCNGVTKTSQGFKWAWKDK